MPASPVTCAAGWFRLEPSGRNAFHAQSEHRMFATGATPSILISIGVRFSPPKYGCSRMMLAMQMGEEGAAVQCCVMWWVRLPPALSSARK